LGQHLIALTVDDGRDGTDQDDVLISVVDSRAPSINTVRVDPGALWPPNHKMVPITIEVDAVDICSSDVDCRVVAVRSSEAENKAGDGDTAPDALISGKLAVKLRAESSGKGSARKYSVTIECADNSENTAVAEAQVFVPHDRGKKRR